MTRRTGRVRGWAVAPVEGPPQRRLGGEQGGGPQDEPGHHVVEGRRRGRQEEQGAGHPTQHGDRGELEEAAGLVADFAAETRRRGHVAGPDPDGVGDVRRQGRVAQREQDREGDQAPSARHPVEDAGAQPRQQEQHDVGRGHARTVRDDRRRPVDVLPPVLCTALAPHGGDTTRIVHRGAQGSPECPVS